MRLRRVTHNSGVDEHKLGEPALAISALRIWVHNGQFLDSTDQWDGNWLDVTVRVRHLRAVVWASGAILTTMDLATWRDGCSKLYKGEVDLATLNPLEPELEVAICKVDAVGHLELRIDITPDHLSQNHTFRIEIDQSYLPGLIRELDAILVKFPVR